MTDRPEPESNIARLLWLGRKLLPAIPALLAVPFVLLGSRLLGLVYKEDDSRNGPLDWRIQQFLKEKNPWKT